MRKKSAFLAKCREAEAKNPGACVGTGKRAVKSRVQMKSLEAKKPSERKSLQRKVKALSAAGKKESAKHGNSTVPGGEAGGPTQAMDSVTALPVSAESTSAITAGEFGQDTGEGNSSLAIVLAMEAAIMEEAACLSIGEALENKPSSDSSSRPAKGAHEPESATEGLCCITNMAAGKAGGPAELEEDCKLLAESIAEETLRGNECAVPADKARREVPVSTLATSPVLQVRLQTPSGQ
ncbi:uncharacterized protein LOC108700642 [Xenopus laevis]|uniref:Uncharacterized protein LOC108700642 n=1 Tax=Xenopus laevis TaxID=8355 RepID=A0A8J0TQ29_XENLA|nr:uncharacterized protein LOC108700642 [Xenopus laevis]